MTWKKWRRGLTVACFTGIAKSMVGLVVGLNNEQLAVLFLVNIGTDALLYMKNHPIETLADTTTFFHRDRTQPKVPPSMPR